jgi:DNA invertase Pin-like site-specific DNA recombinase
MATKPNRTAIYCRVSTSEQNVDLQLDELRDYVKFKKLTVIGEYVDQGISGTKKKRPALDSMMQMVDKGKIDTVLVWKFDRLGRNLVHLVSVAERFRELGVNLVSYQEQFDTSTPIGQVVYTIIAAIANMELEDTRERIIAGQQAAKRRGKHIGRFTDLDKQDRIRQLRKQGMSIRGIAGKIECSTATVQKALKGLAA